MNFRTRLLCLHVMFAVLVIASSPLVAGETIVNKTYKFKMTLPDGVVPFVVPTDQQRKETISVYTLGEPVQGQFPVLLSFEALGGTISNEPIPKNQIPKGVDARVFTVSWQKHTIDVLETRRDAKGIEVITYATQVPIVPQAIQVNIAGPTSRKKELDTLLEETLAGLKGKSNWIHSEAPAAAAEFEYYGFVLLGGAIVIFAVGVVILLKISRKIPVGQFFIFPLILFMLSGVLGKGDGREFLAINAGLGVLGLFALLLAVTNLIRRRQAKVNDEQAPSEASVQETLPGDSDDLS